LLSSFSEVALDAARDAVPGMPRALLLDELPADWSERLARLQCAALDVNHKCLTGDVVAQAHGNGFRVCCYTVNDPARVWELAEWGVDTIITDAVDVIRSDSLPQAGART
jgi:glycerophosphoryl diester phosphodiesterase